MSMLDQNIIDFDQNITFTPQENTDSFANNNPSFHLLPKDWHEVGKKI